MNPSVNEKALALVPMRFVTGGMDGRVKIWTENNTGSLEFNSLELDSAGSNNEADNYIRDVAWSNNIGSTSDHIAVVDENKRLRVYVYDSH
jgi:WD40 repeat protein